jgi:hypothetical protein
MMENKRCEVELRPHKTKGLELVLKGDCDATVKNIMKNLGPYARRYWKPKIIYDKKGTEKR